jgi:hypothetical protein
MSDIEFRHYGVEAMLVHLSSEGRGNARSRGYLHFQCVVYLHSGAGYPLVGWGICTVGQAFYWWGFMAQRDWCCKLPLNETKCLLYP